MRYPGGSIRERWGMLRFLLVAGVALGAVACARGAPAECTDLTGTTPARVTMSDMAFDPACLSVRASQALTLVNVDAADHTFTIRGTSVDLDVEGERTVEVGSLAGEVPPGVYDLVCRYHPGMTGTITLT